tara:strand:- start:6205 stop:6909 length:705 start_codon:yes stop_codon:yes gene_type:complete
LKHFSFDLWLTIIKSNPHFKSKRVTFFHEHYNFSKHSEKEIKSIFRKVDLMCNQVNESVGFNLDTKEMYLMVLYLLNENSIDYNKIDINKLYDEMENLVMSYPPVILSQKIVPILQILKEKNKTVSLLSNTGFIEGKTINKILKKLDLVKYFDFEIYSDQQNLSKPNKKLFEIVFRKTNRIYNNSIKTKDIMHIGDNPIADIQGAQNCGMSTFLVSDDHSFEKLYLYAKDLQPS